MGILVVRVLRSAIHPFFTQPPNPHAQLHYVAVDGCLGERQKQQAMQMAFARENSAEEFLRVRLTRETEIRPGRVLNNILHSRFSVASKNFRRCWFAIVVFYSLLLRFQCMVRLFMSAALLAPSGDCPRTLWSHVVRASSAGLGDELGLRIWVWIPRVRTERRGEGCIGMQERSGTLPRHRLFWMASCPRGSKILGRLQTHPT